jgi:hypothetical protein
VALAIDHSWEFESLTSFCKQFGIKFTRRDLETEHTMKPETAKQREPRAPKKASPKKRAKR